MGTLELSDTSALPFDGASEWQMAPGVTCGQLCEGRVLSYTLRTVVWESVAVAFTDLRQRIASWPAGQPFLILLDMADPTLAFTPRIRQEVDGIIKLIAAHEGRVATILPQSVLLQVAQLYVMLRPSGKMKRQLFFDRASALAWLMEAVGLPCSEE